VRAGRLDAGAGVAAAGGGRGSASATSAQDEREEGVDMAADLRGGGGDGRWMRGRRTVVLRSLLHTRLIRPKRGGSRDGFGRVTAARVGAVAWRR
jgi:hypothetical protein